MANEVTLVTGASGFLGRAVVALLTENSRRVTGLDPRPSATARVTDDLSDRARLKTLLAAEKVTHIIHAGGVSGPMVLTDRPLEIIRINVLGSLNLLYAAADAGVKTFVYCSSAAALGNFYESESVGEDYPLRPDNTYSASKAAMDMVLRASRRCAISGFAPRSVTAREFAAWSRPRDSGAGCPSRAWPP